MRDPGLWIALSCTALAAAGCAQILDIESTTTKPDESVLSVISIEPAADAMDVEPDASIEVLFSDELDESSLTLDTVLLTSTAGPGSHNAIAVEVEGAMLRIVPRFPLALRAGYELAIAAGVRSVQGAALTSDYGARFRIRDGAWTQPQLIGDQGNATAIVTAINPAGKAAAVWLETESGTASVYANRATSDGAWAVRIPLEQGSGRAHSPVVAIDPLGNGLALWVQSDGTSEDVWSSRLVAGEGWKSAVQVGVRVGEPGCPRVAVNRVGNGAAAWRSSSGGIFAAHYVAGGGWIGLKRIGQGGDCPQVVIDDGNVATVVWASASGVLAVRHPLGEPWPEPTRISTTTDEIYVS
ncbi:MAG: Ig-like domain-containing protein [Proteobacteria bacterium]|nr:Ig-like domain-containing protein [Pseudomonadota bacterium]